MKAVVRDHLTFSTHPINSVESRKPFLEITRSRGLASCTEVFRNAHFRHAVVGLTY
jgi:hypothetical protein